MDASDKWMVILFKPHTKPPPSQYGCSFQNIIYFILAAQLLVRHFKYTPPNCGDDLCLLFCLILLLWSQGSLRNRRSYIAVYLRGVYCISLGDIICFARPWNIASIKYSSWGDVLYVYQGNIMCFFSSAFLY